VAIAGPTTALPTPHLLAGALAATARPTTAAPPPQPLLGALAATARPTTAAPPPQPPRRRLAATVAQNQAIHTCRFRFAKTCNRSAYLVLSRPPRHVDTFRIEAVSTSHRRSDRHPFDHGGQRRSLAFQGQPRPRVPDRLVAEVKGGSGA
jgi:hypothetical protein